MSAVINSDLTMVSPASFDPPEPAVRKDARRAWSIEGAILSLGEERGNLALALNVFGKEAGEDHYQYDSYTSEEWADAPEHVRSAILALGLGPDMQIDNDPGLAPPPEGEDVIVHGASFLRVGDWIRTKTGQWERATLTRLLRLRAEDAYQEVTVRWVLPILDWETLKTYETQVAPHTFRMHQGHPQYCCPLRLKHSEHEHRYVYRDVGGETVKGIGTCMGWPDRMLPGR